MTAHETRRPIDGEIFLSPYVSEPFAAIETLSL